MKAEDVVQNLFICSTHSYLLFFTDKGRLYWLKALEIPDVGVSGRGKSINNLIQCGPEEKVRSVGGASCGESTHLLIGPRTDPRGQPQEQHRVRNPAAGLIGRSSVVARRALPIRFR